MSTNVALAWANAGKSKDARMAMMAITTSSSIRVKPDTCADGATMAFPLNSVDLRTNDFITGSA